VHSVHVQCLARSLRNNLLNVASCSEDDLGILKLTFIENIAENPMSPASDIQGRVACRTREGKLCLTLLWITVADLETMESDNQNVEKRVVREELT